MNIFRVMFRLQTFVEVLRQRARHTVAAFFGLVLLSALVATSVATWHLRTAVREVRPLIDALPTVTIAHGQASADVEQPWQKSLGRDKSSDGLDMVLIIDTTGTVTDFTREQKGALLTKTQLIIKQDRWQRRALDLSDVPDGSWGPFQLHALLDWFVQRAPFWLALVCLVWFGFSKLVHTMLMVLVALIARSAGGAPLGFGKLWTLAIYGTAPAVLVDCAHMIVPFNVPWFWLFYLAIAITYTALGAARAAWVAKAESR